MNLKNLGGRVLSRFWIEAILVGIVVVLFADYLFGSQLLYGSDSIPAGMFFRSFVVEFLKDFGELPRWNPFVLGGLPFLDAQHGDTFYPLSLLHFTMPVHRAMGHKLLINIVLAGAFMAFYLRTLRLSPAATLFGAIAYALCPLFVSHLYTGQDGRSYVIALTPLVLGTLERALRAGTVGMWIATGVAISATILSAQIQMAYHLLWYVAALFGVRLVFPMEPGTPIRRARGFAGFLSAIGLALLLGAIQLLPAVAYVKHPAGFSVRSTRTTYEHATSWSLHAEEVASMIVPEFCNSPHGYWGRNAFKYNSDYIGLGVVFLAGLALFQRRSSTRWYLFGISTFAVLYSLGGHTPLHRVFYEIVPQVKLFRAPSLVLFGGAFGMCALAAHAIHDWESGRQSRERFARRALSAGLGIAALLAAAGTFAPAVYDGWNEAFVEGGLPEPQRSEQLANIPAFRSGAWTSAAVLAIVAIVAALRLRGRITARLGVVALGLVTVVDLWRIDEPFKVLMPPEIFTRPDALVAPIAQEAGREKFRVMPVVSRYAQNELAYFGIESTLGFHDNEIAWYRRLRSDPRTHGLVAETEQGFPLLRMLNVKYLLHEFPEHPNPWPVPGYLPRFWTVERYTVETNPDAIIDLLLSADFDPARTVVLEEDPAIAMQAPGGEPAIVRSYQYHANEIRVVVEAERPCLLVHSENWFPYWHAYRGDEELPIYRANGVIRAIPLPEGISEVRLNYVSEPFRIGRGVTCASLAVVGIGLAVLRARRRA